MTLAELITVIIAVYAAIVSTFAVVKQYNDTKRKLRVSAYFGFIASDRTLGNDMTFIEIGNHWMIPVSVQLPYFRLRNGKTLVFPEVESEHKFPHELQPSHSTKLWVESFKIESVLQENGQSGIITLYPEASDSIGNKIKGKKIKIEVKKQ